MSSINKAILIGRLGRDPETRYMPNGDAVTNLNLATSETWKKDGEKQERTEWHRVVMFRQLAEIVAKYLRKGELVYVEGRIRTRKYDKDGQTHYATEIEAQEMRMLGSKNSQEPAGGHEEQPVPQAPQQTGAKAPVGLAGLEDDLPF